MSHNDKSIDSDMARYYDEIAPEYDRIYEDGGGAADPPSLFRRDAAAIAALLPGLVGRAHLDLACGSGYWLRFYRSACGRVTLVDRSARMIEECRKKIDALGFAAGTEVFRADLFAWRFPPRAYDSALLGFLWSHLAPGEERRLFAALRGSLKPGARVVLIDSAWNPGRAAFRAKSSIQFRTLAGGRTFRVRKRYLDEEELKAMEAAHHMTWRIVYKGKAFILAEGKFLA